MRKFDVVIRCKDERKWLDQTLKALSNQTVQPSKIVFVDNASVDGSREYALDFGCDVLSYPVGFEFNYSVALNIGIAATAASHVLLLSAHCVLAHHHAIERLLEVVDLFEPAGVFGRQLPTTRSSAIDTRDLLTVFGRERIIYEKYPFFHNAFSMIDRKIWETMPFDVKVNGIEDRIWANAVCAQGGKIVYEPRAAVYHEHGLNQGADTRRAERICRALYYLHMNDDFEYPPHLTD